MEEGGGLTRRYSPNPQNTSQAEHYSIFSSVTYNNLHLDVIYMLHFPSTHMPGHLCNAKTLHSVKGASIQGRTTKKAAQIPSPQPATLEKHSGSTSPTKNLESTWILLWYYTEQH